MQVLKEKLKEVLSAVFPITCIVVLLNFTLVPMESPVFFRFLWGAFMVISGLTLFLFGVDVGVTPIGTHMGGKLAKSNKMWLVIGGGLVLGFFISIAEPDLHILAGQVEMVTSGAISKLALVLVVSVGVAVLVSLGLMRIVKNIKLRSFLMVTYIGILILGALSNPEFLAIAFDASGATTGAMTVPFILAVALGTASVKKDSKSAEEDSFGLLGIASAGAVLGVLLMSVVSKTGKLSGTLDQSLTKTTSILSPFLDSLKVVTFEVVLALAPIVILFIVFNALSLKLDRLAFRRIIVGLVYTFLGLVLFLVGVNAGFMDVGSIIGMTIASMGNYKMLIGIGFMLGLVTILAEPAVHVLTRQIEEVTSGSVKRPMVLFALSIGVALSVALSVLRIVVPEIQLWHYLLPGYIIVFILTFLVPNLFIGIAFDSGGVASGPMCATFILAFTQGVAEAVPGANVLTDGFGVIAMVALTPLIALQLLGLVYQIKTRKQGVDVQ